MDATKGRLRSPDGKRRFPLAALNSATALPLGHGLAALKFTPNAVSYLSLMVSLLGIAAVVVRSDLVVLGALLVHVGLLLDHADGQVARLRGMGSTWGMYLDMVIDRIVEIGLIVASVAAALAGHGGWALLPLWAPMPPLSIAATAVLCIGMMLTWRFLNAYNDVLYLRAHLRDTGTVPTANGTGGGGVVFNRDWVFAIWVVGTILGQHQAVLVLLLALHSLVVLGKIRAFARDHKSPESRAAAVLDDDYH